MILELTDINGKTILANSSHMVEVHPSSDPQHKALIYWSNGEQTIVIETVDDIKKMLEAGND